MPMVPQYQGGVPQVQDNGSVGAAIVRLPESNFDYAKVMEKALTPVNEFANSFTKTMEVERARMIKAESDDAERQAIDIINDKLMGENGYLGQSGKNAVDGYQSAMEGLRSSLDKVVSDLTPQARQAVESRIYDRLQSATNQANHHRMIQNKQWQLGSSESRVNSIIKDMSMRYSDAEYQRKSIASLMQEAEYTASLKGYDAEQTKAYKEQVYGLAMSSVFVQWAENDPVGAFAAFETQRDSLPPDVSVKLGQSLFAKTSDLLSLSLASSVKEGATAAWIKDPTAKTGDLFIDSLSEDRRVKVTLKAAQLMREGVAEKRKQLTVMTKDNLAQALTTPNVDMLTEDQFVDVEGEKVGRKNYEAYVSQYETNRAIYGFRTASDADIIATVEAAKPKAGSENYAERYKQYESINRAAEQVKKERERDAIQFGIDNEIAGFAGINFEADNAESIVTQLSVRADQMLPQYEERADNNGVPRKVDVSTSAQWGVKPILLSKREASQLVSYLDKSTIDKKVQTLKAIYDAVGDRGVAAIASQMKDGSQTYAFAMSAMGIEDGKSGVSLGEVSLIGADAIKNKLVNINYTAETGDTAKIRKALMGADGVDGVFTDPRVLDSSVEFTTNVLAYQMLNGGGINYKKAIERTFGEIDEFNGKKVIMPRGVTWSHSFRSLVRNKGAEIAKGKGEFIVPGVGKNVSSEQMGDILKDCKLQSYKAGPDGGYQYKVIYNDRLVYTQKRVKDKDGNETSQPVAPLVITLKAN